eukprot:260188-Hanusia_phi.AAC.6
MRRRRRRSAGAGVDSDINERSRVMFLPSCLKAEDCPWMAQASDKLDHRLSPPLLRPIHYTLLASNHNPPFPRPCTFRLNLLGIG